MGFMIIDSSRTWAEAFAGKRVLPSIRRHLALLDIDYWGLDEAPHRGQIIVHASLAHEVHEIFADIRAARFPIAKMRLMCEYAWDDDRSMADNNSSGYNPRRVAGTRRKSLHASGRAIDINPFLNPWEHDGQTDPPDALYDPSNPGTLVDGDAVVTAFLRRGWEWGGHWTTMKDWHHFQKSA